MNLNCSPGYLNRIYMIYFISKSRNDIDIVWIFMIIGYFYRTIPIIEHWVVYGITSNV